MTQHPASKQPATSRTKNPAILVSPCNQLAGI